METIQYNTLRKARQEHKCSYCGGVIPKGMMYESSTHKCDGEVYNWKSHLDCTKIVYKLDMFQHVDDYGLTSEDFRESIYYEYDKLMCKKDPNYKDDQTPFLSRLEYVLKHYEIN